MNRVDAEHSLAHRIQSFLTQQGRNAFACGRQMVVDVNYLFASAVPTRFLNRLSAGASGWPNFKMRAYEF
jgi:hypothetical protein